MLAKREDRAPLGLPVRPVVDEWTAYANYIGRLLNGRPHFHHATLTKSRHALHQPPATVIAELIVPPAEDGATPVGSPLILVQSPRPAWRPSVLARLSSPGLLDQLPGSILFVRQPRRPLRRVLFVVRDHECDPSALSWVERLAASGRAAVTLLPVSALPGWGRREGMLLRAWDALAADADEESALHRYAERLQRQGIHGAISWRPGSSLDQVRREVRAAGHDLLVIGAEPAGGRRSLGGFIGSLLQWADRPVLVAR